MVEIICSGFGGQGVLNAGMILADAGMEEGKNVTWFPSYGSEMRGGTANCNVKISDEEIPSPYCSELDIVCSLNDASIDKFQSMIRPRGILLVNSSLAKEDRSYREDIRVIKVPCTDIANEVGNSKGANIVMLGALAHTSEDFDEAYMRKAILYFFEKKGKAKFNAKNAECFDRGVEAAKNQVD
jgi:2-oxoglutarate ferredoxin oxidoreductase subunit gamma